MKATYGRLPDVTTELMDWQSVWKESKDSKNQLSSEVETDLESWHICLHIMLDQLELHHMNKLSSAQVISPLSQIPIVRTPISWIYGSKLKE